MPFVRSKVSCPITEEEEILLKSGLGRAIELIPGKTEDYLLLSFEDKCSLWLRGRNDEPIAYIEAAVFGNEYHTGYMAFTREVTRIFRKVLNIPAENIYIRFEDINAWGAGTHYIDSAMFR